MTQTRIRRDRCPGVSRPWAAADGMLVRMRLLGGRVPSTALRALAQVAADFGDGHLHMTSRANIELRAFPGADGRLAADAQAALAATGLLPSISHELVRNVAMSPTSGLDSRYADVRRVIVEFDERLCAAEDLARLPAKFLFAIDSGIGDMLSRPSDLLAVALPADRPPAVLPTDRPPGGVATAAGHAAVAQLRIGSNWGPVVPMATVAEEFVSYARDFLGAAGQSAAAPWHVDELPRGLIAPGTPHPRLPGPAGPLPFGPIEGGNHVEIDSAGADLATITALTMGVDEVIVTPWRGILVPDHDTSRVPDHDTSRVPDHDTSRVPDHDTSRVPNHEHAVGDGTA